MNNLKLFKHNSEAKLNNFSNFQCISNNRILTEGVKTVCSAIAKNETLRVLDISGKIYFIIKYPHYFVLFARVANVCLIFARSNANILHAQLHITIKLCLQCFEIIEIIDRLSIGLLALCAISICFVASGPLN